MNYNLITQGRRDDIEKSLYAQWIEYFSAKVFKLMHLLACEKTATRNKVSNKNQILNIIR